MDILKQAKPWTRSNPEQEISPQSFKAKALLAWQAFAKHESQLRAIMDADTGEESDGEVANQILDILDECFVPAISGIYLEVGSSKDRYRVVFSPQGSETTLLQIHSLLKLAPQELKEFWDFYLGRQAVTDMSDLEINLNGIEVNPEDVQVLVDQVGEKDVELVLCCPKLEDFFDENEEFVWDIVTTLMEKTVGELTCLKHVIELEVVEGPLDDALTLAQLKDKFIELGIHPITDFKEALENYTTYAIEEDETIDAPLRQDTISGSTSCVSLVGAYLYDVEDYIEEVKDLANDGVASGFIAFSLEKDGKKMDAPAMYELRDQLTEYLYKECGEETLYVIGGASGSDHGYLDLVAFDLEAVLNAVSSFFAANPVAYALYQSFDKEVPPYRLC